MSASLPSRSAAPDDPRAALGFALLAVTSGGLLAAAVARRRQARQAPIADAMPAAMGEQAPMLARIGGGDLLLAALNEQSAGALRAHHGPRAAGAAESPGEGMPAAGTGEEASHAPAPLWVQRLDDRIPVRASRENLVRSDEPDRATVA